MRGQGRVYQRGNRFWIAYYVRIGGESKENREPGGATRTEANRLLRQRLDEIAMQRQGLRPFLGPASERTSVSDLLDALEQEFRIQGWASLPQFLSRKKRLTSYFGSDRAVGFKIQRHQRYVAERLEAGAKPATVNRETEILQRAFTLAKEMEIVFSVPAFKSLPELNAREGFFQLDQFDAVLQHIQDPDLKDYLLWFQFTGMRPKEIKSLTWAALDRQSWRLILPARSAKTRKPRLIPLMGDLKEILQRRLKARRFDIDLIFHRRGRKLGEFRKTWKTACEKAGVEGRIPYDLRRTAVRNMVRAGVDPSVAMKLSGHKTRSVFDRYNIVADDDLVEAVGKMGDYLSDVRDPANKCREPGPRSRGGSNGNS